MIKKLFPREEYFEDFKEMIGLIEEMADRTEKIFQLDDPDYHLSKMKPLEIQCDKITSRITTAVNKTYITPLDRGDIYALAKELYDISDMLMGSAERVDIFRIKKKIEYTDKLAAIIHQQVNKLGIVIQDFKAKRTNELNAVTDLEDEADKIYHNAIKDLFDQEKDAIEILKKKEVITMLEQTCDICRSTANIILTIFIKNS